MLTYADVCMRQPDCDAIQPHACKEVLWKGARYTAMRMLTYADVCMRQHTSAYADACIRQHTSYMSRGVCVAKALDILLRVC
jgi:hypothetical protein